MQQNPCTFDWNKHQYTIHIIENPDPHSLYKAEVYKDGVLVPEYSESVSRDVVPLVFKMQTGQDVVGQMIEAIKQWVKQQF